MIVLKADSPNPSVELPDQFLPLDLKISLIHEDGSEIPIRRCNIDHENGRIWLNHISAGRYELRATTGSVVHYFAEVLVIEGI